MAASQRPGNVGILAIEIWTPQNQVDAADLETADGVPGKYTLGLEQEALSFPWPCEDCISLALNCVHNLFNKYSIDPRRIGRLEVGSESSPDRCKSIKTHLMRLIGTAGNHDIEGVDCVHACYGGTSALFNSVNWIESSSWDGRLALVVATDVALYAPNTPARATGGAGAAAILIGPNAPLVVDPAWRATYSENLHDFCKPASGGPFPTFQPSVTLTNYLMALDCTYVYLYRRLQKLHNRLVESQQSHDTPFNVTNGILPMVDHVVMHAPFAKLVRKAFARLALHDAVRSPTGDVQLEAAGIPARWRVCEPDALPGAGYADKALEAGLLQGTRAAYDVKVASGAWAQKQVGNTYTASLYVGLAGLWEQQGANLQGQRILLFSFGSGTMSSMFSLIGREPTEGMQFTLEGVAHKMQLSNMLRNRVVYHPQVYDSALQQVQDQWGQCPWSAPAQSVAHLPEGSWYLERVDAQHMRHYTRRKSSGHTTSSGDSRSEDSGRASVKLGMQGQGQAQAQGPAGRVSGTASPALGSGAATFPAASHAASEASDMMS